MFDEVVNAPLVYRILSCRYEYRVEMIHQQTPDTAKNIVREFGIFHQLHIHQMKHLYNTL